MALTNGAKLYYGTVSETGGTATATWANLAGLKEVPEFGTEAEKVEITCLTDTIKKYELGTGDSPELTYKFKFDGFDTDSVYSKFKGFERATEPTWFADVLSGKTPGATGTDDAYFFKAYVSVKRTGGALNEAVDFEVTLTLASKILTAWENI